MAPFTAASKSRTLSTSWPLTSVMMVARADELLVERAGRSDVGHQHALDVLRDAVRLAQVAGEVLVLEAQPLDAALALLFLLALAAGGVAVLGPLAELDLDL